MVRPNLNTSFDQDERCFFNIAQVGPMALWLLNTCPYATTSTILANTANMFDASCQIHAIWWLCGITTSRSSYFMRKMIWQLLGLWTIIVLAYWFVPFFFFFFFFSYKKKKEKEENLLWFSIWGLDSWKL